MYFSFVSTGCAVSEGRGQARTDGCWWGVVNTCQCTAGKMFSFRNCMRTRLHAQARMGARKKTMAGYDAFERKQIKTANPENVIKREGSRDCLMAWCT